MSELLEGIYINWKQKVAETETSNYIISDKVCEVASGLSEDRNPEHIETLRDKLFDIAFEAEKEGFKAGFCYAIQLMTECQMVK